VDPLVVPPGGPRVLPVAPGPPQQDPLEQLLLAVFGALKDALTRYAVAEASQHSNWSLLHNPDTFDGSDPRKLQSFLT
jgi:hypothetical protein